MTQALFEAESGFRDDNVWYLSGEGAPNGTRATDAPVGSSWKDKLSGDTYTRESTAWRKLATGGDTQALTDEVQRIEDAVGLAADGTYAAIAGANYATASTLKGAVAQLDTQLKSTQTDLDTLEGQFATYQTTQDGRDDAQDALIAAKVNKAGDTMTGDLTMTSGARIRGLLAAVNPDEPITKAQYESLEVARDYQADIFGVQTDAAFVPETVLGRRYVVTDVAQLNAAFGTIASVGNNDIVEYNGTGFVVAYDVSTAGAGTFAWNKVAGYWMSWDGSNWSEHGGLSGVNAGVGLRKDPNSPNTLHVNLGAGLTETPLDEVGLDVRADSGLFMTEDGVAASSGTNAQLAIKLADGSLTVGAAGIQLSTTLQSAISANTTAIATEKSRAEGIEGGLRTDLTAAQTLLADARTEKEVAAVTTPTVIDSVLVDSIESAKWIVTVRGTGANAAKKQVVEVLAIHDGTAAADAVACDFNVYGKLRLGTLTGMKVSVELDGAGAGQTMQLKVQSTDEVQVASIREVLFF